MMLKPDTYWVGNVRTIWSHLLVKHGGERSKANQELALYKDGERESEMYFPIWRDIYLRLDQDLLAIGLQAAEVATERGVTPGPLRYMWADAVANSLYERFAARRWSAGRVEASHPNRNSRPPTAARCLPPCWRSPSCKLSSSASPSAGGRPARTPRPPLDLDERAEQRQLVQFDRAAAEGPALPPLLEHQLVRVAEAGEDGRARGGVADGETPAPHEP
jgi:hypothetical protein